jgi:serine/threonine protein kinase
MAAQMDEEEKPPQEGTSDKTVIAPPPTERPQAGPARTRTAERKLQPALEPQVAARSRIAETLVGAAPEPPAAPPRTRTSTSERKAILPEAQPSPPRTRTSERKLLPSEELAAPPRTRTSERKLLPSEQPPVPARTRTGELKAVPRPAAPSTRTEENDSAPITAPNTLPQEVPPAPAPARTRTSELKAVARISPQPAAKVGGDESAPTALNTAPQEVPPAPAPARTRTSELKAVARAAPPPAVKADKDESAPITAPTTLPNAAALGTDAPATTITKTPVAPPKGRAPSATKALEDSPLTTLPGAPSERGDARADERPAVPADRTVMMPYPEKPADPKAAAASVPRTDQYPALPDPAPSEQVPRTDQYPALPDPAAATDKLPRTDQYEALADTQHRAAKTEPAPEPAEEPAPVPSTDVLLAPGTKLGGYQLIERLGAGAMGTVWLARQLSLDRDVAVKVLRPGFAGDPLFLYRFTQEAFAAAQLIHHNIVQVYDCGSEKQIHFFSMEYVDAQNLQSLVKRGGPLDSEVAAGYVLQAARGLKFAHDRGMVHRDIKPDNLLLNHNGVVKVADLGLVKLKRAGSGTKSGPVTYIGKNPQEYAMGTPAYMAPEQVANSAKVDARADIYALGCTLYHLITGRPPFIADTISKVMDMHVNEPPVRPDVRNPRVSKVLSDIVMKMMAKRLDERYQDMGEGIKALETFLGIEATSTFSPREEHANLLESCVKEYNQSPWAKRRRIAVLGLMVLAAIGTGLADRFLGPLAGLGVAAFAGFTWMSSFILRGLLEKGALFLRLRQFVFQAPLVTWLIWLLLVGGAGYGLYYVRLLLPMLAMMGGALVFAVGFYLLVDRNVEAERKPPVLQVEQMLRSMRLRGLEESALRQFVCKYSGESWEGFFEALFGYDAKILARRKWGLNDRGLPRLKHSTWRDPLIRAMEAMQVSRKNRRERRQLKMLEKKKIKAQQKAEAEAEAAANPE